MCSLTHTVSFDYLRGRSLLRKQRRMCTSRRFFYTTSGTRRECAVIRAASIREDSHGVVYATQLQRLAEVAPEKRPRLPPVHLLHDKARPHVANATLQKPRIRVVPHPSYADIAALDYHLLRSRKAFLAKNCFTKLEDFSREVVDFLDSPSHQFCE